MLGKIEVIDKRIDSNATIRLLLVNHIVQSEQNLTNGFNFKGNSLVLKVSQI